MAIDIKVDHDNQIRTATITGKVTFEDLLSKLKEIYVDRDIYDLPNSLWDIRQADVSSFTADQISKVAEFVAGNWGLEGKNKTALVADENFIFGLSRMYELMIKFKSPSSTRAFTNYDDALIWLKEGTLPPSSTDETVVE